MNMFAPSPAMHCSTARATAPHRVRFAWLARALLQVAALICVGMLWTPAHAVSSCNIQNGNNAVAAGTISLPANSLPGTVVSTAVSSFNIRCFSTSGTLSFTSHPDLQASGALASGFNNVYVTSLQGLGVRYTVSAPSCTNASAVVLTGTGKTGFDCPFVNVGGSYVAYPATIKTEFVVIGNLPSSGTITSIPPVLLWYLQSDQPGGGPWQQTSPLSGSASGNVTGTTCTVTQKNIAVTLATMDARDFAAGVGTTAASTPLSLSLTCPSGIKLAVTLTDGTNSANRTDTLALAAGSTARGVGVQILNGGAPLSFGPDSADYGNQNQWAVGSMPGGAVQVPLTARYIRTGAIAGGTVKALATFTMSYQ